MTIRNVRKLWVAVTVTMVTVAAVAASQPDSSSKNDGDRLLVVQEEFLNIVKNLTGSVKDVEELMSVLHSQHGREMGRLLMEGVILGSTRKDSAALLIEFWAQLQGMLSPELQEKLKDYTDFFGSLDISTLPYFLDQLFKKDGLGKSMAHLPMGQLVDMVQPAAAKYGVDLRAIMNSVMGVGNNNARDLIYSALDNLNVSSLFQLFSPPAGNEGQTGSEERKMNTELTHKPAPGEKNKEKGHSNNLRLFRPLIASLLREHKIDLDPDAVLQVLSPLLNGGDFMSSIVPLLSIIGSQKDDTVAPFVRDLMKHEEWEPTTLVARTALKMLGKRPPKLSPLTVVVQNLIDKAVPNFDIMELAENLLGPRDENKAAEFRHEIFSTEKQKHQQVNDIIECILRAFPTMEEGFNTIKNYYFSVKASLVDMSDSAVLLPRLDALISRKGKYPMEEKMLRSFRAFLTSNYEANTWRNTLESFLDEERLMFAVQMTTPVTANLVMSSNEWIKVIENTFKEFLASLGVKGVTWNNCHEVLGPLLLVTAKAQGIPLIPATHLKQLKSYFRSLHEWVLKGLTRLRKLPSKKLNGVVGTSLKDVGERVVGAYRAVWEADPLPTPQCLPVIVCRLNTFEDEEVHSLSAAATRFASLVFTMEPVLAENDPTLLLSLLQASSGRVKVCQTKFGAACSASREEVEDEDMYPFGKHVEL